MKEISSDIENLGVPCHIDWARPHGDKLNVSYCC